MHLCYKSDIVFQIMMTLLFIPDYYIVLKRETNAKNLVLIYNGISFVCD